MMFILRWWCHGNWNRDEAGCRCAVCISQSHPPLAHHMWVEGQSQELFPLVFMVSVNSLESPRLHPCLFMESVHHSAAAAFTCSRGQVGVPFLQNLLPSNVVIVEHHKAWQVRLNNHFNYNWISRFPFFLERAKTCRRRRAGFTFRASASLKLWFLLVDFSWFWLSLRAVVFSCHLRLQSHRLIHSW